MADPVHIELEPLGRRFAVDRGTPLQDVLFSHGVEFPCGGRGKCRKCRVRVLGGAASVTEDDRRALSAEEIAAGWRLACQLRAESNVALEIAQWQAAILADDTLFPFTPRDGLGIAVDLGTTTLVAQLLDLRTGHVLAVRTALNPQVAYGADVMSRVEFALADEGRRKLTQVIHAGVGELLASMEAPAVREVAVVGNTVMHHLFCGIDPAPLAHCPFEPAHAGLEVFPARELGWGLAGGPAVRFLPCLGGFVGSDILAGILATGMHESEALVGLVDLGTNGEIVCGNREQIVCASAAAGPAFEGGRISMGMRAQTGAISEIHVEGGRLRCHVLGAPPPRGLCGSGLVDAAAAGLELGVIQPSGRFANGGRVWELMPPVVLSQADIRELQLAKAAIAAGIRIVLHQRGAAPADVARVYLAGAFGNYINRTSARRVGLIDFPLDKIEPAGNTALLGAKMALFLEGEGHAFKQLRARVRHISLASDPRFQEIFAEEMLFPEH